jgi:hypothetical protein
VVTQRRTGPFASERPPSFFINVRTTHTHEHDNLCLEVSMRRLGVVYQTELRIYFFLLITQCKCYILFFMHEAEPLLSKSVTELQQRIKEVYSQYEKLELRLVNGIRILTAPSVSEDTLNQVATLYPSRPKGAQNCYHIAAYALDLRPQWDSIHTKEEGYIVQGNHSMNIGNSCLIDLSAEGYFDYSFEALVLPLPPSTPPNLQNYLTFANLVYGGNWNHLGKDGYQALVDIAENARKEMLEKLMNDSNK